jgi:hypothetical protein
MFKILEGTPLAGDSKWYISTRQRAHSHLCGIGIGADVRQAGVELREQHQPRVGGARPDRHRY